MNTKSVFPYPIISQLIESPGNPGWFRLRLDLYRGRRLDEDQQNRATNPDRRSPLGHSPTPARVCATGSAGPVDPAGVFGVVAAGGPPRLAALVTRLNRRLSAQPAHTNNTINDNDYYGGKASG